MYPEVVGEYTTVVPTAGVTENKITIGEALEAAGLTAGDKVVDQIDAAAIQAAEGRATGYGVTIPGGIATAAQAAANSIARAMSEQDKTTLGQVLCDTTSKLPSGKAATKADAERVTAVEIRNDPNMTATTGGVAASVIAAARLNQERHI